MALKSEYVSSSQTGLAFSASLINGKGVVSAAGC